MRIHFWPIDTKIGCLRFRHYNPCCYYGWYFGKWYIRIAHREIAIE